MIRLSSPADAAQIAEIYRPFCEDSPVSFEIVPPDAAQMAARIGKTAGLLPWLVAEQDGAVLGYAYASRHRDRAAYRWSVDVTVYVRGDCRRQGVGRALYSALFALLRLQGYFKAYAGITLPNPGSEGLHDSMGFRRVGVYRDVGFKAGAWRDVAWLELTLQPPRPSPPEPRPYSELIGAPGWSAALPGA